MHKKRDEDTIFPTISRLKIGDTNIDLDVTRLMAIINVTEDSFYADSRVNEKATLLQKVELALEEGADIIDLGAQSTRPGATQIPEATEIQRVKESVKLIKQHFPHVAISVDTYRSSVAQVALTEGAGMINDVSGGSLDANMYEVVANAKAAYCCMHMRGTPVTMQEQTRYEDVVDEVFLFFQRKYRELKDLGIEHIVLDPGIGFAKTLSQNFDILNRGERFHRLGIPILYGVSRKSLIQKTLHVTAEEALNGTTVIHSLIAQRKRSILRVHDVREAKQTIQLLDAFTRPCQ